MTVLPDINLDSQVIQELVHKMAQEDYKSFDPYDGLSSPFAKALRGSLLKRVFVQGVKRTPYFFRPVFLIPKHQMAVVLAHVLESVKISDRWLTRIDKDELERAILLKQKPDGGWGYEFDAVLRWGSYTAEDSNLIATYFCVKALNIVCPEGAWKAKAREYLEGQFAEGFFRYANSNESLIHNANLLGALALHMCGGQEETVQTAIHTSLELQNDDGSWWYGEAPDLRWVDSFHTCYVLQALAELDAEGFDTRGAISRGKSYWDRELYNSGELKYFSSDLKKTSDLNTIACALHLEVTIASKLGSYSGGNTRLLELRSQLMGQLSGDRSSSQAFRWKSAPALLALAYSFKLLDQNND